MAKRALKAKPIHIFIWKLIHYLAVAGDIEVDVGCPRPSPGDVPAAAARRPDAHYLWGREKI